MTWSDPFVRVRRQTVADGLCREHPDNGLLRLLAGVHIKITPGIGNLNAVLLE
jgi:hypothetical protein